MNLISYKIAGSTAFVWKGWIGLFIKNLKYHILGAIAIPAKTKHH